MRLFLAILLVVNTVCAIGSYPLFSMASAAGKAIVMSSYRGLELQGLRNPDFQAKELEGSSSNDWAAVPEHLAFYAFNHVKSAAAVVTFFFGFNAVSLFLLLLESPSGTASDKKSPASE